MTSLSFDQYRHLSPEERARHDDLYRERMMDPQHRAFLAGLLKMSLDTADGLTSEGEFAIWLDSCSELA